MVITKASFAGVRIRERMREKEIGRAELSAKLGVTDDELSLILVGETAIGQELALKLESILEIPACILLDDERKYRIEKEKAEKKFPFSIRKKNGLLSIMVAGVLAIALMFPFLIPFFGEGELSANEGAALYATAVFCILSLFAAEMAAMLTILNHRKKNAIPFAAMSCSYIIVSMWLTIGTGNCFAMAIVALLWMAALIACVATILKMYPNYEPEILREELESNGNKARNAEKVADSTPMLEHDEIQQSLATLSSLDEDNFKMAVDQLSKSWVYRQIEEKKKERGKDV